MTSICQIFQIDSNEEIIDFSRIEQYKIIGFGNGIFTSKDGLIASVAHVIMNHGLNSYALSDGKLYKIKIIERELNEYEEIHNDSVIGKIDIKHNTEFIGIEKFENVTLGMNITIKGYSRISNRHITCNEIKNEIKAEKIELKSFCFDMNYYYSNARIRMVNFFAFIIEGEDLRGLSGSPIFNDEDKVVGLLKGGSQVGDKKIGQALHIKVIIKMLYKIKRKAKDNNIFL